MLPLIGGIGVLALLQPPIIWRRPARLLDFALILSLTGIALQLIPLPPGLRGRVAPAAVAYDRALRFGSAAGDRPLSIDPAATFLALIVVAAIVLLFWTLRAMFHRGGVRFTIRAVAWVGLFVSPLAIVQHVMPLPAIDLMWEGTAGLRPYGPFVNRNDFAGWLIMAMPLTLGYAVARIQPRHRTGDAFDPQTTIDSKSIWLGTAICLILAGLLFSTSRSGLLGAFAGLVFFAAISRRRLTARRTALAVAGLGVALAIASAYADMGALSARFLEGSLSEGLAGRLSIWRQTWPVVRNFWPFGTGAGTYQAAMVLYQTMSRYYYISHADNEFLQILAEGGLLLGLPLALALVAGVRLVAKRLRTDHTRIFWLRAGAAAGIVAVATQNMVEMTMRVPANAVLFAILAAVAAHEGDR